LRADVAAALALALTAAGYAGGEPFTEIIEARLAAAGNGDRQAAIAAVIAEAAVVPDEYDADGCHWISLEVLDARYGIKSGTVRFWNERGHPALGLEPGNTLEIREREPFQGKGAARRRHYVREDQIVAIKTCTDVDPTPSGMVDRARMRELGVSNWELDHFSKQLQSLRPKTNSTSRRERSHPLFGRPIDSAVYDAVIDCNRTRITRWSEADGKEIGKAKDAALADDWEPPEPKIWIRAKKVTKKVYGFTARYAEKHGVPSMVLAAPCDNRNLPDREAGITWVEYLKKDELVELSAKVKPRGSVSSDGVFKRTHTDDKKHDWLPWWESRVRVAKSLVGLDLAAASDRLGCPHQLLLDLAKPPTSDGRRNLLNELAKALELDLLRKKVPGKDISATHHRHGDHVWVYGVALLDAFDRNIKGEAETPPADDGTARLNVAAAATNAAPLTPDTSPPARRRSRAGRKKIKGEARLQRLMDRWETVKSEYRGRGGLRQFSLEMTGDRETLPRFQGRLRIREHRRK
jgi:hypothetical protein